MDLSTLKPNTIKLKIKHPETNKDIGLELELSSVFSDEVQAAYRDIRIKTVNKLVAEKSGVDVEDYDIDVEILEVAASVRSWSWSGGLDWKGKVPEFTPENVNDVLSAEGMSFIRFQIKRALDQSKGFFPSASAKSVK